MPPPRARPDIRVPTDMRYGLNPTMEDHSLSSLSPASLSTTFSSATYYSIPQIDDNDMDVTDDNDFDRHDDEVVIKTEDTTGLHLDGIRGCCTPPLMSPTMPTKRKPGRPTKVKVPKDAKKMRGNERSKTGCLTCRKRKKKCDETKPMCLNCTKTNYKCEGYPERKEWVPSSFRIKRTQSSEGMESPAHLNFGDTRRTLSLPHQPRLNLLPAIENDTDSLLLDHFTRRTCRILTIHQGDEDNPYFSLILPMAMESDCLMHSVLALSGTHLARCNEEYKGMTRQMEHSDAAYKVLGAKIQEARESGQPLEPAIVAALIINCLTPIMDGDTKGQYKFHLGPLRDYVHDDGTDFGRFAWEFYKQYEFCTTLTSLPDNGRRPDFHLESFERVERRPSHPGSPASGILLASTSIRVGVLDGSFLRLVSDITHLRDRVRSRQQADIKPPVDPLCLSSAERIDRMLWDWDSGHRKPSPGNSCPEYWAAQAYRHACLCYLSRTIRRARPLDEYTDRFNYGIEDLQNLPPNHPTQCNMLLPTFLLGCAAFKVRQRQQIERVLDNLEAYSHSGNIRPAREVLRKVWSLMDDEDDKNWDWETIMHEMGYDILIN